MAENESIARIELGPGVWAAADALQVSFARAGGPGGQNVNKLNTKALLWLDVSGIHGMSEAALRRLHEIAGWRWTMEGKIHITAANHRTQERNRQEAMDKLREIVVRALAVPKVRRKTRPTRASRRRRLEDKQRRSDIKSGRSGGGNEF